MNQTNEQLMEQFQHGNIEALSIIYKRLHEPLYCFLFRYTKDEQLSVDTVHDAFELLQKKKHSFHTEKGTVKSYLFQIGYRLLINKLNRRKRWQTLLPFLVPTEKKQLQTDETLVIQAAISNLPDKQRAVILLAYYDDLPMDDIAQILSIPVGTVKSRLHHAMKSLKLELKEAFGHERGY
ncbi:RNA polymerase sigma factor [Solibacillus sp. MA9]|uniref:RNA polymerase sigma factor n=1 Tax=Solibacillus palustris TaxID=2908203 RepID=A0ABS9UC29_9BACL|nr:RNA polymerase sigma factor [Solibacillus sp. MA9]MCH7321905.1 RNA polymerase sigma factor [Solibacillus sp. MA9]